MKKIIVFIFCAVSFCVSALSPVFTNGVKISFIGDSITQHGTQQNGFIHLFMDGLKRSGIKNASFVNEGIGGARSSTLLERIDRMLAKKPRIVVLQCGVNDVGWGKKGCTLEQYKENMGRILDKCKEAGAEVIWVTPTMHTEHFGSKNNILLASYCDFVRQEAAKRSLILADWNRKMQETLKAKTVDGDRMFVLTVDKLHLNGYGNLLLADTLLAAVGVPEETLVKWHQHWNTLPAMTVMINVWHNPQYKISINDFQKLRREAGKQKTSVDALLKKAMDDYIKKLK